MMKLFPFVAALLALQMGAALAQITNPSPAPKAPPPTPPSTTAPVPSPTVLPATPPSASTAPLTSPVPDTAKKPAGKSAKRMTQQQHFDAANVTHDGKLTREQADTARWGFASRHFDVLDRTHRGYITMDDVHAYNKAARGRGRHKTAGATPAAAASPATVAPVAPVTK